MSNLVVFMWFVCRRLAQVCGGLHVDLGGADVGSVEIFLRGGRLIVGLHENCHLAQLSIRGLGKRMVFFTDTDQGTVEYFSSRNIFVKLIL